MTTPKRVNKPAEFTITAKVIGICILISLVCWMAAGIWAWCYFTQGC